MLLVLAAMACQLPSKLPIIQLRPSAVDSRIPSVSPTLTVTVTASPTFTATATATEVPTETTTLTSTPTPRLAWLEIVATGNVIIRAGPCYEGFLANARPGTKFVVTGWYRSPQGEDWLQIEFRDDNNKIRTGWVRADLAKVTNSDLVPPAFAICHTPTPDQPSLSNSYIRLYKQKGFNGEYLDIKLTSCGIVNINSNSVFHDSISSFDLFAPPNVEVFLTEHQYYDARFPGNYGLWQGNNGHLRVDVGELKALSLQDEISSVIWVVNGELITSGC